MFGTKSTIEIGHFFGIPVGLHWSWFFIFALVTGSLAAGYYPALLPSHAWPFYWALGAVTSLLFFSSVLAHEYGHAFMALYHKIPVTNITLMAFGGVAQIGLEPRTAAEEFQIAIAGPLISLAAAALFGIFWLFFRSFSTIAYPAEWLARINLALVIFNMVPGIPLDGGRVARALLWWLTHNRQRATRFAGIGSQAIAFGFIGVGLFSAFGGNFVDAIWLVFVGGFLGNTAAAYREQASTDNAIGKVRVAHVMNREFREIPIDTHLKDLKIGSAWKESVPIYFLFDGSQLCGALAPGDFTQNTFPDAARSTVRQTMTPIDQNLSLHPDDPLITAIAWMDSAGLSVAPVLQDGRLAGYLTRDQVASYMRSRSEL
jgi:Zn-dependent protease